MLFPLFFMLEMVSQSNEDLLYIEAVRLQSSLPDKEISSFIFRLGYRIFTEWCMDEGKNKKHSEYNGEAFDQWITDEIHYLSEREKNGSLFLLSNFRNSPQRRIIRAVINAGIDFYSNDCSINSVTPKTDRNLRRDLRSYL